MINFILGGLFVVLFLPVLEGIMEAICTRIEQYKVKCNVKIAEYNEQIAQIQMGESKKPKQPIGFQCKPEEK